MFNTESNQAIEGLAVERVGVSKLYIMVVTATRIYEFCGSSNFTSVFEQLSRLFSLYIYFFKRKILKGMTMELFRFMIFLDRRRGMRNCICFVEARMGRQSRLHG